MHSRLLLYTDDKRFMVEFFDDYKHVNIYKKRRTRDTYEFWSTSFSLRNAFNKIEKWRHKQKQKLG